MLKAGWVLFSILFFSIKLAIANPSPSIAAAADLKFALTEAAQNFKTRTGNSVRLSFGSSGNFTHQIESGAPFEVFLSADEKMVFRLADKGLTRDRGHLYAIGRIVFYASNSSPILPTKDWQSLKSALQENKVKRFAIANPAHAPYGRAARAALEHRGVWDEIQPFLILGENAAQATQFSASTSAQGGIIPLSLALSKEVGRQGRYELVPSEWHQDEPLRQRMVLLKSAGKPAEEFYQYLQTPEARKTFETYGFTIPKEP